MEENKNSLPFEGAPALPVTLAFPTGKRELILCAVVLLAAVLMANFLTVGGFYMAFGIASAVIIVATTVYLLRNGRKLTFYSGALLTFSVIIALSFGRSEDGFVKFVMFIFLCFSANLGLCLLADKNHRDPKGFTSIADAFRAAFMLGLGKLSPAFSGLSNARKNRKGSKAVSAVLAGLLIAVPLVLVLVVLLASADAAFEGLMKKLPKVDLWEPFVALILGVPMGCFFYTRAAALQHAEDIVPAQKTGSRISTITINTVLGAVCFVYGVYLVSQLSYLSGGLSGILPEEFTMAEYARRGFFEMAVICTINLFVISLAVGLTRKEDTSPLSTRLLCLFVGLVTLLLVAAASAKMLTYIDGYGLTRLRVMTQLIILFFGLAAVTVSVSMFLKTPRYMPVLLIGALLLGGSAFWVDVDTLVAAYNVSAYQHGVLETVDVEYLGTLSSGAIPQIAKLLDDQDPQVAEAAQRVLNQKDVQWQDFRDWNYADWRAKPYVSPKEDSDHSQTEY